MTFANFPEEKLHTCAFFCGADYLGLARKIDCSTKKVIAPAIFFFGEKPCLNSRHCLAVSSEGTRPKGRGVPKYENAHLQTFPKKKVHERVFLVA